MSNFEIEVKNDEMLGKTDSIYATRFYVMQKQIDELQQENEELKKQLEDRENFIKKMQSKKDKLDKYNYEITMQQKKITIRELYQRVLDGKPIIKKIRYYGDVFEYNAGEHFYRHYGEYGSYWLPFNLDKKVEILGVSDDK